MKTLSTADYELLKSRGKVVNGFNTIVSTKESMKTHNNLPSIKANSKHDLVGKILHTSWGYDMTMNDFCKIVEVSPTGKTVKCRMIKTKIDAGAWAPGGGKAEAVDEMYGPYFRLKVNYNENGDYYSFHGSYPFCGAENLDLNTKMKDCSSRKGYFSISNPGETYYENHWD